MKQLRWNCWKGQGEMQGKGFKYQLLKNWILEGIRNKSFRYGEKLPSENFLCRKFGIGRQTVRKAMAQLEEEGIIQAVRGSGRTLTRSALLESSDTVGVLVSHMLDYLFTEVVGGVREVLSSNGFEMDLAVHVNGVDEERAFLKRVLQNEMAGLLVEGVRSTLPNPNIDLYYELQRRGIPIIFIHNYYEGLQCPSVLMDDIAIARDVTKLLLDAGHTMIAGIFKGDDLQGPRRYKGYLTALMDKGVAVDETRIGWFYSNYYIEMLPSSHIISTVETLKGYTAIVCYNDLVAQAVCRHYEKKKIKVPEDISMVSFDDTPIAEHIANGLTSGQHPHKLLGIEAATRLMKMIHEGVNAVSPTPYLMPYKITIRGSIRDIR